MISAQTLDVLWWAGIVALVVGGAIYAYMEYHAHLLRTHVTEIQGGLRFSSQIFTLESQQASREVVVQTRHGRYTHQPANGGEEQLQTGSLTATFAAVGLRITTTGVRFKAHDDQDGPGHETGFSNIIFSASDELEGQAQGRSAVERSTLQISHVPNVIAHDFALFALRLEHWIDKMEQTILRDLETRRKEEEERQKAEAKAAAAAAKGKSKTPAGSAGVLGEDERQAKAAKQIAAWRATAGFKGSTTEFSVSPQGEVVWLIDLDPGGRVTLHGSNRTFHGSLRGAKVTALTGELEVSVRDEYWSDDDPRLASFKILAGVSPEVRQAWKERLELLIRSLY